MIILITSKVLVDKEGNKTLGGRIVIKKWQNDHDFGFDVLSIKAWRNYLTNVFTLSNGKKLPTKTKAGDEVCYRVYAYGLTSEWLQLSMLRNNGKHVPMFEFFPGYSKLNQRRPIPEFGVLKR